MAETDKADETGGAGNVLARKLAATKDGTGGLSGSLMLRALRRSLARAATDLCELPLGVIAARQCQSIPEDLPDHLDDSHLLILLDGPDNSIGAASLDAALVTALIQQQTMGQVLSSGSQERNYTQTDAAMMAEFLETSLSKVTTVLQDEPERKIFDGYKFGAQIEEVRKLVLTLEAEDYRIIRVNVDLAGGQMQGELVLILPEPQPDSDDALSGEGLSLAASMGSMRAELSAVLCKMRVPLNELSALNVGDMLPLDQAFLYETDMQTISGQSIVQGRLGQMNGARAVRMNVPKTKLVSDLDDTSAFGDGIGAGAALPADEPPTLDLEIAAQGLQDPMEMGGDLAGGLDALGGDLASEINDDLSGGLDGLADDLMADLGDLPPLEGGLGDLSTDEAALEITELAGLDSLET